MASARFNTRNPDRRLIFRLGEAENEMNKENVSSTTTKQSLELGEKTKEESPFNNRSAVEGSVVDEKLFCVLYQNVKISVYQGDITKETADVIVSPADEELQHTGASNSESFVLG